MNETKLKIKNFRSLRSILVIWFFIFSILPLAFVAWYSLLKFEKAINNELAQRLAGNGREIEVMISDFYSQFLLSKDMYIKSPHLIYNLSVSDASAIKEMSLDWIEKDIATSLTFYDREGRLLSSVVRDSNKTVRSFTQVGKILLNEKYLNHLKEKPNLGLTDFPDDNKVSLILFSKVVSNSGKIVGYVEQSLDLKEEFLNKVKNRLKLEAFLVRENGQIVSSTQKEFSLLSKNYMASILKSTESENFFEVSTSAQPYGFILYPIQWDKSHFYIALGTTKKEAKSVLKNVNIAFLSVIAIVVLFLIVTILFSAD